MHSARGEARHEGIGNRRQFHQEFRLNDALHRKVVRQHFPIKHHPDGFGVREILRARFITRHLPALRRPVGSEQNLPRFGSINSMVASVAAR